LNLSCHISSKLLRNWLLALIMFRRNMKNVKKKKRKRLTSNWIKTCSSLLMRFSQPPLWLDLLLQLVLDSSLPSACRNNHLSACNNNHPSAWHHLNSVCSLQWDSIQAIPSDNSERINFLFEYVVKNCWLCLLQKKNTSPPTHILVPICLFLAIWEGNRCYTVRLWRSWVMFY